MHDYLFTTEVVRFAFMFGVAVSMLLYERRHLTTGSIVVPGYIAIFLAMPFTIIATFVNAFLSYMIVNRFLRRWFLLYGRTKFTVLAMISILIQTIMLKCSPTGAWLWERDIKLMVGVGYVVPALIAHDMARQGFKKTIKSVMLAGVIVATPIALALALHMPGVNDLAPLRGGGQLAIDASWIPIAVLLSAGAAWGVARNWDLRSGGFMGAAFVAILLGDPWQVVVVAVLAIMTYVIVVRFLMNSMILFGRRKFSSMLLVSASMSWALLWVGDAVFGFGVSQHMDLGSLALTPLIVPGLLANDSQRTSPARVIGGLSLATTFVLSATWTMQAYIEHRGLDFGWQLLALGSGLAIFGKPLVTKAHARMFKRGTERESLAQAPAGGAEQSDDHSFGLAGYRGWAAMHREAAEAAERWLASVLGERPALAVAGSGLPTRSATPRHSATTTSTNEAGAPGQPTANDTDAPSAAAQRGDTRSLDRLRTAAVKVLGTTAPVAGPPLPTRQRRTPRVGEFDSVSTDILSAVDRRDALPRRRPTVNAHPEGSGFELPVRRPIVIDQDAPISESSDVVTRAHHATSDARGNRPDEHEPESKSGVFDVFPG
jgi:poly-gamma-glutamate biosynthesis protein PgsC/CapC